MEEYTEEAKQIYIRVCSNHRHHWLRTSVTKEMAMEMIAEALSISNVKESNEQLNTAWKALEYVGFRRGEEFDDDDVSRLLGF